MEDFMWSEQYRTHNQRGSEGPCECDDCMVELVAFAEGDLHEWR